VIVRPNTERAKILAVLASSPEWVTRQQIKSEVPHPKGYSKYLGEFEHVGWIERRGPRRALEYRLTQAGRTCWNAANLPAATSLDKRRCEVWTNGRWQLRPVSLVYPYRDEATYRCPVCHGPVQLMTASHDGRNAAHFEHRPAHVACPLVHKQRRGVTAKRPAPVLPPSATSDSASLDYLPEDAVDEIIGTVSATQRERLQLARVGQGTFRKALLRRWKTCSVLSCGPSTVLIASHIVAWSECVTNAERLDPNNGLLLTPNLDKLFDRRLISFKDSGEILVHPALRNADYAALGIRPGLRLRSVPSRVKGYLARHRADLDWVELT
jgi:hypothetical protein